MAVHFREGARKHRVVNPALAALTIVNGRRHRARARRTVDAVGKAVRHGVMNGKRARNGDSKQARRNRLHGLASQGRAGDAQHLLDRWHTDSRVSQREYEELQRMIRSLEARSVEALEASRSRNARPAARRHKSSRASARRSRRSNKETPSMRKHNRRRSKGASKRRHNRRRTTRTARRHNKRTSKKRSRGRRHNKARATKRSRGKARRHNRRRSASTRGRARRHNKKRTRARGRAHRHNKKRTTRRTRSVQVRGYKRAKPRRHNRRSVRPIRTAWGGPTMMSNRRHHNRRHFGRGRRRNPDVGSAIGTVTQTTKSTVRSIPTALIQGANVGAGFLATSLATGLLDTAVGGRLGRFTGVTGAALTLLAAAFVPARYIGKVPGASKGAIVAGVGLNAFVQLARLALPDSILQKIGLGATYVPVPVPMAAPPAAAGYGGMGGGFAGYINLPGYPSTQQSVGALGGVDEYVQTRGPITSGATEAMAAGIIGSNPFQVADAALDRRDATALQEYIALSQPGMQSAAGLGGGCAGGACGGMGAAPYDDSAWWSTYGMAQGGYPEPPASRFLDYGSFFRGLGLAPGQAEVASKIAVQMTQKGMPPQQACGAALQCLTQGGPMPMQPSMPCDPCSGAPGPQAYMAPYPQMPCSAPTEPACAPMQVGGGWDPYRNMIAPF